MLRHQFPLVSGLQETPNAYPATQMVMLDNGFSKVESPSVQVHYTDDSHWVRSFKKSGDSTVNLFDSLLRSSVISTCMKLQLGNIYGKIFFLLNLFS